MEIILFIKKVLVLIPARYKSSRFQGKPLALIHNKPMIQWVYESCEKLNKIDQTKGRAQGRAQGKIQLKFEFEVAVVTDDERIQDSVSSFGGKYIATESKSFKKS